MFFSLRGGMVTWGREVRVLVPIMGPSLGVIVNVSFAWIVFFYPGGQF